MSDSDKLSPEAYERARYHERIGNESIRQALEENRRLGLPNYFSRDGQTVMELPDGSEVILNPKPDGQQSEQKPEAA